MNRNICIGFNKEPKNGRECVKYKSIKEKSPMKEKRRKVEAK